MNSPLDPETLRIPAYLRKKAIVSQARQKLILTALDRKEAGLVPNSKKATARSSKVRPVRPISRTVNEASRSNIFDLPKNSLNFSSSTSRAKAKMQHEAHTPQKFLQIGHITNYLDNISVAIIKLTATLKIGNIILIEADDHLYTQAVNEMQIDRQPVKKAKAHDHIGLKVSFPAKIEGKVYKIS